MEIDRAEKPFNQMRKLLKNLTDNPAPGEVHELRTRARKIEAIAATLQAADAGHTKRLLKLIKPLRKAAGEVRDMDVLTGDLLHIPRDHEAMQESLVRLVEHMGTVRRQSAGNLLDTVNRRRKPARRSLKKYIELVESVASGKKKAPLSVGLTLQSADGAASTASDLMSQIRDWPRLTAQNIHPFRLKVKELRYVLQLFPDADRGLVDALGKVKDEIGAWHDWQQLQGIARQVLDARQDKALLAQIDAAVKEKLAHALAGANALRRKNPQVARARRKA